MAVPLVSVRLLKGNPDNLRPPKTKDGLGERIGRPRVRCPACGWEPKRDDHWTCECLHSWNTFDTGGVCPSCLRQWMETQCPQCHVWSRHEDWYEDGEEDRR